MSLIDLHVIHATERFFSSLVSHKHTTICIKMYAAVQSIWQRPDVSYYVCCQYRALWLLLRASERPDGNRACHGAWQWSGSHLVQVKSEVVWLGSCLSWVRQCIPGTSTSLQPATKAKNVGDSVCTLMVSYHWMMMPSDSLLGLAFVHRLPV